MATLVAHHRVLLAGFDRGGLPVYFDKLGANWAAVLQTVSAEQVVYAHVQQNEFNQRVVLPAASRRAGRTITRHISVLGALLFAPVPPPPPCTPLTAARAHRAAPDLSGLSLFSLSRNVLELFKQVRACGCSHAGRQSGRAPRSRPTRRPGRLRAWTATTTPKRWPRAIW